VFEHEDAMPRSSQYPSAIFNATSTAVDPESEKNTRVSAAGISRSSPAATASAGSWLQPAKMIWSSRSACAAIPAMIRGLRWPWVVTHQLEIASTIRRPSLVNSAAPSLRTTVGIGSPRPCWVKGCQIGELMRNPPS
jgi:hypothetical protein